MTDLILITDIGSTTTKALLLRINGDEYSVLAQSSSKTTVEKPLEDVNIGVINSIRLIEKELNIKICDENNNILVQYITTSSAGGGLQIVVMGLTKGLTGAIANSTAYGAGGIVSSCFTLDDGINDNKKIQLLHELAPDMILFAGGIDGGSYFNILKFAGLLKYANLSPKFKSIAKLPVLYCGNQNAIPSLQQIVSNSMELITLPNIMVADNKFNTQIVKEKIIDIFMHNVMSKAPGYESLVHKLAKPILPTPVGVEKIINLYAKKHNKNIVMFDMGGATTDVFSVVNDNYKRSVAANIGMSYSITNILKEAGIDSINRHFKDKKRASLILNYIKNKNIYPTNLAGNRFEAYIENAIASEGLRLSYKQHLNFCFKEHNQDRFETKYDNGSLFKLSEIDVIIGSGGIYRDFNDKLERFLLIAEAIRPKGVTQIVIDKDFKSPHMGCLSVLNPDLALKMLENEFLEELGVVIAPHYGRFWSRKILKITDLNSGKVVDLNKKGYLIYPKGGNFSVESYFDAYIPKHKNRFEIKTDKIVLFDTRNFDDQNSLFLSLEQYFDFEIGMIEQNEQEKQTESHNNYIFSSALPVISNVEVKVGDKINFGDQLALYLQRLPKVYIIFFSRYGKEFNKEDLFIKAGDKISIGDQLYKGLIEKAKVVESKGEFKTFFTNEDSVVTSNVEGIVDSISEFGEMVVKEELFIEKIDEENRLHHIDLFNDLKGVNDYTFKPTHINQFLKVKVGAYIEKNFILAERIAPAGTVGLQFIQSYKCSKAPISGFVESINPKDGVLTINHHLKTDSLKALISGEISFISDKKIHISCNITLINLIAGYGKKGYGKLTKANQIDKSHQNHVVFSPEKGSIRLLQEAKLNRCSGLIIPSIDYHEIDAFKTELSKSDFPFCLLISEGFGEMSMSEELDNILHDNLGKTVSISAITQLRAGVVRPYIMIPRE